MEYKKDLTSKILKYIFALVKLLESSGLVKTMIFIWYAKES